MAEYNCYCSSGCSFTNYTMAFSWLSVNVAQTLALLAAQWHSDSSSHLSSSLQASSVTSKPSSVFSILSSVSSVPSSVLSSVLSSNSPPSFSLSSYLSSIVFFPLFPPFSLLITPVNINKVKKLKCVAELLNLL